MTRFPRTFKIYSVSTYNEAFLTLRVVPSWNVTVFVLVWTANLYWKTWLRFPGICTRLIIANGQSKWAAGGSKTESQAPSIKKELAANKQSVTTPRQHNCTADCLSSAFTGGRRFVRKCNSFKTSGLLAAGAHVVTPTVYLLEVSESSPARPSIKSTIDLKTSTGSRWNDTNREITK